MKSEINITDRRGKKGALQNALCLSLRGSAGAAAIRFSFAGETDSRAGVRTGPE